MMMVVLPKGEGRGAAAAAASASSFFGMSVFGPCIRSPSPSNHPLCYMVVPYSRACSLTLTQDAVTSSAPLTMSRARLHRCASTPHHTHTAKRRTRECTLSPPPPFFAAFFAASTLSGLRRTGRSVQNARRGTVQGLRDIIMQAKEARL